MTERTDETAYQETATLLWETGDFGYTDTVWIDETRDPVTLRVCVGGRCVEMPLRDWVETAWDADGHILALASNGEWTMQHPRTCRPDLISCPLHRDAVKQVTKLPPGRYQVIPADDGAEFRPMTV